MSRPEQSIPGIVRASCGCTGHIRAASAGAYGKQDVVSVYILDPCTTGHPERVRAGVTERFSSAQLTAIRLVAAQPAEVARS